MSNSNSEYLSLREATRAIPSRPSYSTLWRWMLKGVKGHRLQSTLIGGQRFVTRTHIDDFLAAINGESKVTAPSTPKQRQRAIEKAERELAQAGYR